MSVLVIDLPPRPRGAAPLQAPADYAYTLSADGRSVGRHARADVAALPRATTVCARLDEADVSWQRLTLPRAPAAKLRAALGAVLEDQLLEDDDALHLALEPGASAGQPAWVAVVDKAWLALLLTDLERQGVPVERVLPATPPPAADAPPVLHALPALHEGGAARAVFAHDGGVQVHALGGSLLRAQTARLLAQDRAQPPTAHPAVVAEAERAFGVPVAPLADPERALAAAAGPWNLRQFELAPRHRGLMALGDGWRRFNSAAWRPLRWGLAALLAVQFVGLQAWAWSLDHQLRAKRQAMTALLQATHPQVRAVLDAPVQMQRETETLRAAAGRPGPGDFEALAGAAAAAWPPTRPPAATVRFEPGALTLGAPGWTEAERVAFAERARAAGARVTVEAERLVLTPQR